MPAHTNMDCTKQISCCNKEKTIQMHPFVIDRLHHSEQLLCIFKILTNLLNRIKPQYKCELLLPTLKL